MLLSCLVKFVNTLTTKEPNVKFKGSKGTVVCVMHGSHIFHKDPHAASLAASLRYH